MKLAHVVVALSSLVLSALLSGCGGDDSTTQPEAVKYLPCDVDLALTKCRACHGSPPNEKHKVPFTFLTYADTQATSNGMPRWKLMQEAIDTGSMPLEGPTLTAAEKAALDAWFAKGAPGEASLPKCN